MSSLEWGVKRSLLDYVGRMPDGVIETSDGAQWEHGVFRFPAAESSAGGMRFRGTVMLTGHGGMMRVVLSGPGLRLEEHGWVLDVTDPDDPDLRLDFATVGRFDGARGVEVALTADGADLFFGPYEPGTPLDDVVVRP